MSIVVNILILIKLTFLSGNDCKLLPDGCYKMKQVFPSIESQDRLEKNYQFEIENGNYLQIETDGTKSNGNLLWLYDKCTFRLKEVNPEKPDPDKLEGILASSFGQVCFEIQRANRDTIFFRTTYTGNLHITTSKGYFVRMDSTKPCEQ